METVPRYEIVDTIATGDFATVYRARDRELGREVAVKQIHQQFLSDPRQLERYWHEAQLLASLQHPNILTIYDIVRSRGWLILELMRGSLQQSARGSAVDLDFLRTALIGCLDALKFLHTNGVIHGDVKPSNMLVDLQHRVKLGDFGLARRVSSSEGSLLKGTTKYMAPELVTNQFGPVGPASDLYSLGFSAYELMCGPRFDSLFPGLTTLGRDEQIAWLMWHAAADRKLPQIARVLEGVPEDLARVVQRLVTKDQARRYASADDVLRDLRPRAGTDLPPAGSREDAEAEAAKAEKAKRKRNLRIGAIFAVACSAMLCLFMLLPGGPKKAPQEEPKPTQGVVRNIYPDERKLVLQLSDDDSPREISVKPRDRIFINDNKRLLRDLQPGDRVKIELDRDEQGRQITNILASRPATHKGRIGSVEPDEGQFTMTIDQGEDEAKELLVRVPNSVKIVFNGKKQIDGKPVRLADLRIDDRVVVEHIGEEAGRRAIALNVERVVTFEGILRDVDATAGQLTIARGKGDDAKLVSLPLAPKCEITINQRRFMDQKMLKPADLKPGDTVSVAHDTRVVRVDAYRVLGQGGVVRRIQYDSGILEVMLDGRKKPTTLLAAAQCAITLGGDPVKLVDLRVGDIVDVTHDSPDATVPQALTISARRPPDAERWAILVGIGDYEDRSLSRLKYAVADAGRLRDVLVKRYRVPPEQTLLLRDESLVRLEQGILGLLGRIDAAGKVIVYFAGHAYKDDKGEIYLAPKNFDLKRIAGSGLSLQWLVDRFEECPAGEKLLLLDCSHAGEGADPKLQPSTAEMIRSLKTLPDRSPLRTVTAVASCAEGQRGQDWPAKKHGVFAECLAEGYSGPGDKNRDNRLEATELFTFLQQAMTSAEAETGQSQTPVLFLPDARPPRLSEDAKKAIRKLAPFLHHDRVDTAAASAQYAAANQLAGKELEPKLLYGLVLLKSRQRHEAEKHFEEMKAEHPDLLLPLEGLVWLRFSKRSYQSGVEELAELVRRIPQPDGSTDEYPKHLEDVFGWVGQLREFAHAAAQQGWPTPEETLQKLDAAVAAHGPDAEQLYRQGRNQSRDVVQRFDALIGEAKSDATASKLRVQRRQLVHYASFPFDQSAQRIMDGLDR